MEVPHSSQAGAKEGGLKPRLLDLFCGAGGAGMGYHQAGFEVVGIDNEPQPNYPFEFILGDALGLIDSLDWDPPGDFDAIHASPPCQRWTEAQRLQKQEHPDLVTPLRPLLEVTGRPYVIENVVGAPLREPVLLDGTMFLELRTKRPRLFETNWPLEAPFLRWKPPQAKMGRKPKPHEWMQVVGNFSDVKAGRKAMGIDWMTRDELREAIPPVYTKFIGEQLLTQLNSEEKKMTPDESEALRHICEQVEYIHHALVDLIDLLRERLPVPSEEKTG